MRSLRILRLFFATLSVLVLVIFTLASSAQTFTPQNYPAATPVAGALARADLNHDGFADILNVGGTDVFVLLNNRDGTFRAPIAYTAGGTVANVKIADVNADTHPDVIVSTVDPDETGHIAIL